MRMTFKSIQQDRRFVASTFSYYEHLKSATAVAQQVNHIFMSIFQWRLRMNG